MNLDDVRARAAQVRDAAENQSDADAHLLEDGLYLDLLHAISEGLCPNPKQCAAEAILTQEISFSRWYE